MTINILKVIIILAIVSALQGCAMSKQGWSHFKSETMGLNRIITLYGQSGNVIRVWNTKSQVEDRGGSIRFMAEDKAVQISGTYIVEEI